jgi:biopolymer transport protein ExbB/TolQ
MVAAEGGHGRGRENALNAARRVSARAASLVHKEMKWGLASLATIASTAPLIGIFGTLVGIVKSFPAMGTDKRTALAIVSGRLSESLVPTVLALIVALVATGFYKCLRAKVEAFDTEMENASLEPINHPGRLGTS